MALNANALLTLDEARARLGNTSTEDQGMIEALVNGVSQAVEGYLARGAVRQVVYTNLLHDGPGEKWLLAKRWPVATSPAPAITYTADLGDTWNTVDPAEIIVEPESERLLVIRKTVLPWGLLNVRLSMTAGYATVPSDITLGAGLWLSEVWRRQSKQLEGVASVILQGQETTIFRDGLSKNVRDLLDTYRSLVT